MISHAQLFRMLTSGNPLQVKLAEAWIAKLDTFELKQFLDWIEKTNAE